MRKNDIMIGMVIYGWTSHETDENDYYDEFFGVYRPRPRSKDDLYPSWSTSGRYAVDLMSYLIDNDVNVEINRNGSISIKLDHLLFSGEGKGDTVPAALADAVEDIGINYVGAVGEISTVKEALLGKETHE